MKEKISVKTLYLLGIITIGLIGLGVGSTYAMFTASAEIDNPISINANLNSEDDIIETIELELEPNDIRVAVINLNNTSNTTLNYASFYITKSTDIEVGVTHNFTDTAVPTGSIENGTTKKVYIQIKNNGNSTTNVTLGVLSNSGNIVKSESMTLINDTNIDTTSPELLITGQDMIVKDGLIRYYDGNNNSGYSHSSNTTIWKDLSGNYDGEVISSTWENNSIVLDGTNSYVNIGNIDNLTAFTLEAYLIVSSYDVQKTVNIISNYESTGIALYYGTDGIPRFIITKDGGTKITLAGKDKHQTNDVHTITGTFDGTTAKLYIDSVLVDTKEVGNTVIKSANNTPMVIGCNPNPTGCDTGYNLNGKVYSAKIYNRALTETEIKQNMNADRISAKSTSSDVNGTYTFISNKRLSNFTADNITLTNGTKGTFTKVNDRKYNLNISGVAVSSTLGLDISENVFTDISGNNNTALTYSRYRDGTGPKATITKNTSTSRTVTYTFTFQEYAYGFTADDITISEGTKGTFTKIDQKTYTLVVTHSTDGSKTITVKANSCNDRFGNLNASKSLTHTIDTVKPTVTISKNTSTSKTVTYTFTFSKAVTGFTASSVTVSEGTKGTFTKVSDTKYTLVVTHSTYGSKTITVAAGACKDSNGNGNIAKSLTHTIGTPLATYITNLYKNGTKSTATVNSITYNRVTAQLLMNDRKGSSSIGADAGNIRYYGANPNNYVYFNCSNYSNQSSSTCEVWRIIGIFDGKVKIMRKNAIGSYPWEKYWSGGNGTAPHNDWTKAKLMRLLNTGYESEKVNNSLYWNHKSGTCYKSRTVTSDGITTTYDTSDCDFTSIGIKDGSTKNMIVSYTYGMKGWNSFGVYPDQMYNYELSTGKIPSSYATTWTGKVALPSVSDYGYAIDIGQCSSVISANVSTTCKNSNWLNFNSGYWFLNQHYNSDDDQVCYYRPGNSTSGLSYNSSHQEYNVHPVVFLSSSVNVDPSTKGTSSNPYKLLP